jgi:hypothetical protein
MTEKGGKMSEKKLQYRRISHYYFNPRIIDCPTFRLKPTTHGPDFFGNWKEVYPYSRRPRSTF